MGRLKTNEERDRKVMRNKEIKKQQRLLARVKLAPEEKK